MRGEEGEAAPPGKVCARRIVARARVAAEAVLRFQKRYDGDSQKTRELFREQQDARIAAQAEETRQVHANLIDSNVRLSYIKQSTRALRGRLF